MTLDYRYAFLFLGLAQLFGSLLALIAIIHRRHNCFRPRPLAMTRGKAPADSLSALLENGSGPSGAYVEVEEEEDRGYISMTPLNGSGRNSPNG